MTYQFLKNWREGDVERLVLSRPDVRNAFNGQVISELRTWADRTAADDAVRVVVISGAGKVFSGGADLAWMASGLEADYEDVLKEARALHEMLESLDRLPQALVARVHGAAIAGGVGLMSVCDVVVAADDAVFAFSEVKLGIAPAVISPFVIGKIGVSAARELFLTGARFSAARAREIGLVHRVVPLEHLDATVEEYIRELSQGPAAGIAAVKRLVRDVAHIDTSAALRITGEVMAARRMSPEARTALRAFLDKRLARQHGE
jgi:methylglutaconyl-CoA hydratase